MCDPVGLFLFRVLVTVAPRVSLRPTPSPSFTRHRFPVPGRRSRRRVVVPLTVQILRQSSPSTLITLVVTESGSLVQVLSAVHWSPCTEVERHSVKRVPKKTLRLCTFTVFSCETIKVSSEYTTVSDWTRLHSDKH